MFIGRSGRLYGSGHEYVPLVEGQSQMTDYEIVMNQEEALNRPNRGRECDDSTADRSRGEPMGDSCHLIGVGIPDSTTIPTPFHIFSKNQLIWAQFGSF